MPVLTNDCPDTRARVFLLRAAVLIIAAIAPLTVWAVCTCGFQAALEDPINGTSNPRPIPGADILYTITISNQGPGSIDNNSVAVTDAID